MHMVAAILFIAAPAIAQPPSPPPIDLAQARASLSGKWEGSLEYLDYGANKWFGIPVKTLVEDQGDRATMIRRSDFDDGPVIGNVRITTVELFDATNGTVSVGTFRKGREPEISLYTAALGVGAKDATHWTMLEETKSKDDNRPAMLRLTTVRDGDSLETLKQIDFLDDDKAEWITRNRTRLTRVGS
jgi:hypothetical protein